MSSNDQAIPPGETPIEGEAAANAKPEAGLGARSAAGGLIVVGAQVSKLVIQLGGTAVIARLLTPEDFGLVAMAGTVTGFISLFTDFGLSTNTVQRKTVDQRTLSILFTVSMAVAVALFACALALAPAAAWFYDDPRVLPVIIGMAATIPIAAAGSQHGALLLRDMRFGTLQAIAIAAQVIALVTAILFARFVEPRYFALVVQAVSAALVSTALLWAASRWRPNVVFAVRGAGSEIAFGAYLSGFSFLNYLHDQFDNVLLGWRYGGTELGYYSRAYNLLAMPLNVVSNAVAQATLPMLSRLAVDRQQWSGMFLQVLTGCAMGSLLLSSVLFVATEPLVHLVLGTQWTPVILIFKCLAVASIFGSATSPCGTAFVSLGLTKDYFHWALFASPLFALSFTLGLPYGALGVAVAYSIAMAILAPLYVAFASYKTGFSFRESIGRLVPLVLTAGLTCLLGSQILASLSIASLPLRLIAALAVGAITYCFCCALLLRFYPLYDEFAQGLARLARRSLQQLRDRGHHGIRR